MNVIEWWFVFKVFGAGFGAGVAVGAFAVALYVMAMEKR